MACTSYPNICIVQGQTYRQTFTAEGNWSGAECRGQIRDNWLNSDGAIKAVFEFGSLSYDDETDLTTVEGAISHQQTTLLPTTKYQGTGTQSVKNSLVYDVEIELDDNVFKLAPGYVRVIAEVSDYSVIYDPPVIWNGGIDNIELTETNGLIDTYTIWGDADKTINLGTFNVTNSEGVGIESANYDNSTGVLTFIYTDGSEFSTEDIRGEKGDKGDSPVKGVDYFDGVDGYTPIKGVDYFDGSDADLDAATIKTRYESNDDTNAFTDAEKTKLAGITAGAEVNVNADWNAVSGDSQILNKPTLGTAAATDSTDYATTAQGGLADTALQPSALNNTVLTGIPTAPTAPEGTDTTQIATTAFVLANSSNASFNFSVNTVTYNDGGTSTIDANSGGNVVFSLTSNGSSTTIAMANIPTTGTRYAFELHLTWTSGAITFPASWSRGENPPSTTGNYLITGITIDGGTSFTLTVVYQ